MTVTENSFEKSLPKVAAAKFKTAAIEPSFESAPMMTPEAASYVAAPSSIKVVSRVFSSDAASPVDLLGDAVDAAVLAEMLVHKGTQTPVTLGLFGGPGVGKSTFVALVLERVQALSVAAEKAPSGPFHSKIVIAKAVLQSGASAVSTLAGSIHEALSRAGYGQLLDETQHAGRDPQQVAREAQETLGETRQRLDTERQVLHDLNGRNARLADTVLFEAAGSRVDAYARKRRGMLEPRLRAFGFEASDPLQTFKTLIRDVADARGAFPRFGGFLRSLWAFKGQTKLILLALASLFFAWAAGFAIQTQATWTASLKSWPENIQPVANYLTSHADWLHVIQAGFLVLTFAFLLWNVSRAIRFFMPVSHGVGLLRADVSARKRDIDGLLAHQTQRVNMLSQEVDIAAKRAAEAQARGRSVRSTPGGTVPAFVANSNRQASASAFLRSLNELIANRDNATGKASAPLPQRIIVCFDGFDSLTAADQAACERELHECLAGSAIASVITVGSASLATDAVARMVQIPYDLGVRGYNRDQGRLITSLLEPNPLPEVIAIDPTQSVYDQPLTQKEIALLNGLAEWVGPAPRDIKRFVNLYRVARALEPDNGASLAFALALQNGGSPDERAAFDAGLTGYETGDVPEFASRLGHFVTLARKTAGGLQVAGMRRALALARRFSAA